MNFRTFFRILLVVVSTGALAPLQAEVIVELIQAARAHNPDILKAQEAYQAAIARVPQAKALPNPALELETMGSDSIGSAQTVRIAQAFPWPGVLGHRESAASLQARAYWHQVQAIELQVASRLHSIGAEIAYLQKEATLIQQNLNLFIKQEDFLEQATRGGGEVADLVRVEMESGLLGDELAQNVEMVRREVAELESIIGREVRDVDISRMKLEPTPAIRGDRDALMIRLESTNPMLQSLSSRVDAARAGVELARLETYPDFMVSAGYRRVAEPGMGGGSEWMNEAVLMFSVSLPIWREKNRGIRNEAASNLEMALQERESVSRMLRAQLDVLLSRERDATRRATLFEEQLLPKARQAHESVEASYRSGSASLLDVFASRRRLLEIETVYWRSIADSQINRAEIAALFGTEIQVRTP